MGFKLRDFSDLVGIDKETSTYNTPVFKKDLPLAFSLLQCISVPYAPN